MCVIEQDSTYEHVLTPRTDRYSRVVKIKLTYTSCNNFCIRNHRDYKGVTHQVLTPLRTLLNLDNFDKIHNLM